jgi:hypothetical protein
MTELTEPDYDVLARWVHCSSRRIALQNTFKDQACSREAHGSKGAADATGHCDESP